MSSISSCFHLFATKIPHFTSLPVDEVLRVSPDFVVLLGLQQSLTPSRNNGFLSMLKQMQRKALELFVESEKSGGSSESSNSNGGLNSELVESSKMGESESNSSVLGSRGERIKEKLERELSPVELEVEDISYQHAGHAGARGSDGEMATFAKTKGKRIIKTLFYTLTTQLS